MTANETPAALLRRAADRLDALAEAASGTRWWTVLDDGRGLVYADTPRWPGETGMGHLAVAYESNRGDISEEDATWMGVLGPQIAAPLSAWLRAEAQRVGGPISDNVAAGRVRIEHHSWGPVASTPHAPALALARSILGEAGTT